MCLVPAHFPGTVGLVNNTEAKALLHPSYRRYKDISMNSDQFREFKYFLDLLQKTNPRRHRFHQRQHVLISEVFTASDEAFALMVLFNEHGVWVDQREMAKEGKKGNALHLAKRFCDGKSGNKDGWSRVGLGVYKQLLKEVIERRNETKDFEEQLRSFLTNTNKNKAANKIHKQYQNPDDDEFSWISSI